ncbi:MAG: hypothetical protein JRJ82_17755 [Deltaproteobacteria bacterium]|nr:hypothetical protein [Deltaproteobacteria bacterium]
MDSRCSGQTIFGRRRAHLRQCGPWPTGSGGSCGSAGPPPFTIKKKELDLVVETMESVLEKVLGSAHT